MLTLFQNDETVKAKISSGEWDFRDVALNALASGQKKQTPAPIRSGGNNTSMSGGLDFSTMTDEQLDQFNAKIAKGAKFVPR